jgi:hypothetical protein
MITQQHNNGIKQKAQAPSSVKEHRWIVVLCSILGVALPMVGGWWVEWPLIEVNFPTNEWTLPILVLVVLPVAVGAFLFCFAFRAWWVAVFAGVAWYISNILTYVVHLLVIGAWSGLQNFLDGEGVILLAVVPILIGMALGAACAYPLVKWRASRQEAKARESIAS